MGNADDLIAKARPALARLHAEIRTKEADAPTQEEYDKVEPWDGSKIQAGENRRHIFSNAVQTIDDAVELLEEIVHQAGSEEGFTTYIVFVADPTLDPKNPKTYSSVTQTDTTYQFRFPIVIERRRNRPQPT
jgi:hypothetical protein